MSLRALFERIGRGGTIEKDEIGTYLSSLGVGDGWLGKLKIKAAIQVFMGRFDREPKDGGVSWDEMLRYGARMVPGHLRALDGTIDLAAARRELASYARADGTVDEAATLAYLKAKLPAVVPTNLTEALARLMLDALDDDDDGKLSWADFEGALTEINGELSASAR